MNKYAEIIETCLSKDYQLGLGCVLIRLDDTFNLFSSNDWNSRNNKLDEIIHDRDLKLPYIYLLSIVDQETADEMIELLKEPA